MSINQRLTQGHCQLAANGSSHERYGEMSGEMENVYLSKHGFFSPQLVLFDQLPSGDAVRHLTTRSQQPSKSHDPSSSPTSPTVIPYGGSDESPRTLRELSASDIVLDMKEQAA